VKVKFINHFWVGTDILVYPNGATQEVFHLVNSAKDASAFGRNNAKNVMQFFGLRANNVSGQTPITFAIVESEFPKGLWIVHGKQEVEIDSES
jgi:hypothetical protein